MVRWDIPEIVKNIKAAMSRVLVLRQLLRGTSSLFIRNISSIELISLTRRTSIKNEKTE